MTTATTSPCDDPARFVRLTASERCVLTLLAHGLAPKQAAWELQVAISTVRSHIAAAKRKSGARTLQQLVGAFARADVASEPRAERNGRAGGGVRGWRA